MFCRVDSGRLLGGRGRRESRVIEDGRETRCRIDLFIARRCSSIWKS